MQKSAIGLACAIVACGASVNEYRGPKGERMFELKCRGNDSDCVQEAGDHCERGYTVVERDYHSGGVLFDCVGPGPARYYVLRVACNDGRTESAGQTGAAACTSSTPDACLAGCKRGEAESCTTLGMMYSAGKGVPQDDVKAAALFRFGCQHGSKAACDATHDAAAAVGP